MNWIVVIPIVIALLLAAFFSGIEVVFISANKLSIELRKKQDSYSGKTWSFFLESPVRFIISLIIVINLLIVIYVLLASNALESVWKYWSIENQFLILGVETIVATIILVLFQSFSRSLLRAKNNSVTSSGFLSFWISAAYSLFSIIATYFLNVTEWVLKYIFNVKVQQKMQSFNRIDLDHYVQQLNMTDSDENLEMNNTIFENVLSLSETRVRECLVPRKEVVAVDINLTLDQLKEKFVDTKLSKLVVYENNVDNMQGYVHQLDLFKNPESLRSILLPIPVVPESMNASDLINKFTKERKSIAWVIDEFGGTAGIVTMEDLLEEIFGDINDEYDVQEELVDKQITSNEFLLSGRLELDLLEKKYKLSFRKSEEAETLSGYIINLHESIPRERDRIIIDDYQFDVLKVSQTRIETVKLKVLR
ncbi:MAG TPA: hemolysin family protein [Hanamia sp.]|nr:hemolysin family protein [Hanamia sp.]